MTAQMHERLLYEGQKISMASEPLNQYLDLLGDRKFVAPHTACWRGYLGSWEIRENRLYLIGLTAYVEGYQEVGMDFLFPDQQEVFAGWFNGKIRIPTGEMLYYVHGGYGSIYEKDIILSFDKGVLIEKKEVDNYDKYQRQLEEDSDLPF